MRLTFLTQEEAYAGESSEKAYINGYLLHKIKTESAEVQREHTF